MTLAERLGVDAVQREGVEVEVQVVRRAEPLDEGDGAALLGANAPPPSCASAKLREQGTNEGAKDFAREPRVVGAAEAERVGEREHPLTDRHLGQNTVDQMRSRIRHTASSAGRTEAAALARECDQAIVSAPITAESEEAVCEDATAEECEKLLLDEARRRLLAVGRARKEVFQLLADDPVKERLLRFVALVLGHGGPVPGPAWGSAARQGRCAPELWHRVRTQRSRRRVTGA